MLTIRESICYESLDDILFVKEKEGEVLPLTLYQRPELINLIILYIHRKVDSYPPNKKTNMKVRSGFYRVYCLNMEKSLSSLAG